MQKKGHCRYVGIKKKRRSQIWIHLMHSKGNWTGDFKELGQNDVFLTLRLSHIFLPKHLQNCFALCCIFPRDRWFDKDNIIQMFYSATLYSRRGCRGYWRKSFWSRLRYLNIL
ncbi:hypothetical protein IEQ34_009903 [Dendrobium chrysotoxum]|uniref:Uncharacterized protein n=1 Tax=Dendrobium chrysotoxum TaxID=161865 RepID=A0AAV7H2U3_DENCH|nr:hypothetical protein IEQ34_009903 [Dendrobium chrysotoxum]